MTETAETPSRRILGGAKKIHRYFLEEREPFSQKRKLNAKAIKRSVIISMILVVGLLLLLGNKAQKQEEVQEQSALAQAATSAQAQGALGNSFGNSGMRVGGDGGGWNSGTLRRQGQATGARSAENSRQFGASQIVRPGGGVDGALGSGFGLPMASTIAAKLLNKVLSSDNAQPVMAEIQDDAVWHGSVLIPAGTKAIGGASLDDTSKRLQIRFNTLVYPEGDEHPVSAVALLPDGSSGLPGDYHSGETQKAVGRFLGDFIGGLADGMQDQQAAGQLGITFEPGSLRNGILNGFSTSALDEAKSATDGMKTVHPYLEVPSGASFLLYFEKEYSP